jgi:EmrB/QacA subfamily drug resistance transporter
VPTVDVQAPAVQAQLRIVLTVGMCAVALAGLDQTIVSTAQPTIVGELGGIGKVSWIFTAYMLASAVATPVLAKLSDIHSRRRIMQLGILVFAVGSVACGLAQTLDQLIVARAVQGIGGGGLFPVAMAMVGDLVSPRQRGRYVARLMAAFTTATVLGPTVGGWIVDNVGWRWAFLVNAPLCAGAILVAQRAPAGSNHGASRRFDAVGLVLIAGTTTTLLLALQWGGRSYGWASVTIVGLFAASAILLVGLLAWESRTEAAIIPPHLFRSPLFRSTMLISIGAGLLLGAGPLLFPLFLQYATGRSATNSGLIMLPVSIGTLAGSTFAGRYIASTGRYRPLAAVGFATAFAALLVVATMDVGVHLWLLTIVMFLFGTSVANTGTVASTASQSAVQPSELGVANGVNLFIRMVGASISVAVSGAVFDARLGQQLAQRVPAGTTTASGDLRDLVIEPDQVRELPPGVARAVIESIAEAVNRGFMWLVPIAFLGIVVTLTMRAPALRDGSTTAAPGASLDTTDQ